MPLVNAGINKEPGESFLAHSLMPRSPSCFMRLARLLALGMLVLLLPAITQADHGKQVIVGAYNNEPKILINQEGQPSGIQGDLLQAIAREEGWTLRTMQCEWQACLDALREGKIDLLPDTAYSEERARQFDFHQQPALHSWSRIYRRDGIQLESILDLHGKRIAVVAGSIQQTYLAELLPGFGIQAELLPVKTIQEAFSSVANKTADVMVASRFTGDVQAPRYQLLETSIVFLPSKLFYASRKGHNADLLAAIDRHLAQWQSQQGSLYYKTLERWMDAPHQADLPAAVWWGLAVLSGMLLLTLAGVSLLRRQVAEKTRQLRDSETRLNTILDSVEAYIFIKDRDYRYQYVNRKVCELFNRSAADVIGHKDHEFFDATTTASLRQIDQRVLEQGERIEVEEINCDLASGETRAYLSIKLPLRRPDGKIYALCGVSTDITRQKKTEQEIHQLAFYDPLTQLPNRRLLQDHLQHALAAYARHPQDGALLFIDLDNFKDLNDTLGHDTGDALLVQVAERLNACTREEDTVARLGGDEFVVMLQDLSALQSEALRQTEQAAKKISAVLGQPYELAGQFHQCSVSIGIAMFSDSFNSKEILLKRADMAMYQAKADGRNTVRFFNPAMQAKVSERASVEADLREALAHGQFVLHYQPQVDASGHIVGAEALVRWQHPQHGLLPPGRFIPVAESSGLILPLGDWILQAACQQLVAWAGNPATAARCIAVNVSAYQFRQPDFADKVLRVLQQTGARADHLKLELTESQLIDDVDSVIAKMTRLRAAGVRFSLDDFGTGYSSLSFLKRLPLDQLKIDRSFIRDLLTDPDDAAIIKAILTLGESLELNVIAEGVETVAQQQALQAIGCRHFQGYLFGRPVPAALLA